MPIRWPIRLAAALTVTTVLALISACQSGTAAPSVATDPSTQQAAAASSARAPSSAPAPNAAEPNVTGNADQVRLFDLLPKPPAGATQWTGAGGNEGILTLERFIEGDTAKAYWPSARINERRRGFTYAARVNWCDPHNSCADTYIAHFTSTAGAEEFYQAHIDSDASSIGTIGAFTVPGITNSQVHVRSKPDSYGETLVSGYVLAGNDIIKLQTLTPTAPNTALAVRILTTEYRAIMSDTH